MRSFMQGEDRMDLISIDGLIKAKALATQLVDHKTAGEIQRNLNKMLKDE